MQLFLDLQLLEENSETRREEETACLPLLFIHTQVPQRIHIRKSNLRQKHLTNLKMSYKIAKEYKSEFSKLYVD